MGRFEDVDETTDKMVQDLIASDFADLTGANVRVIFDLKKRKSGGMLVMGRLQKSNELLKHVTSSETLNEEGVDYFLYIDKMLWNNIENIDKVRLIRHELQHSDVDMDSATNPYKIKGHEIEDFYDEVERNSDDIRWAERCVTMLESLYEMDD